MPLSILQNEMKEEAKPTNKEDNERLRKIFESIDENGDGKLSPEEVRRFISTDETPADGSRSSNSTELTPASANRLHKGSTGAPHREGEAEGRELDEETATRMIEVLDQDKDGTIDYTEFKRYVWHFLLMLRSIAMAWFSLAMGQSF
eukprot:gb/GECG01010756.1/.p1 GENE.gb/GECG01010756.1/~~gb/GECG01010756.1/.p1  ORF type:complete len:147 (+),score=35.00 gb/GECG01010756.1/:1-441(+)